MTTAIHDKEKEDALGSPVSRSHTFVLEDPKVMDSLKEIRLSEDQGSVFQKSSPESEITVVEESSAKDGGYGWIVLCGASLSAFTAFSTMQSWYIKKIMLDLFS